MNRRVSIADVAREANASITSVSRVMNDVDYPVSSELRGRILAAIERLNYTPSSAAQRLRSHFSAVIGIIVRDISNTYFGDIARGATDNALKHGHLTFICDTGRSPVNEYEIHELLWKNRVRGIVLVGGGFDEDEYRELMTRQLDRVANFGLRLVSNAPQGVELPSVTVDFSRIMDTAVEHLVSNGHECIAMITGHKHIFTCQEHVRGYQRALRRHAIPFRSDYVAHKGFAEADGYAGCKQLLSLDRSPTAICCASDLIAVGALRAGHDQGLSVPKDLSVVGVGDSTLASYVRPSLTTIQVPRYEMGAKAVEAILADGSQEPQPVVLETSLVSRDSVQRL